MGPHRGVPWPWLLRHWQWRRRRSRGARWCCCSTCTFGGNRKEVVGGPVSAFLSNGPHCPGGTEGAGPGPASAGRQGAGIRGGGALGLAAAILLRVPSTAASFEATFSRLPSSPRTRVASASTCLVWYLISSWYSLSWHRILVISPAPQLSGQGCPPSSGYS